jgi:hypothetical protein
MHVVKHFRQKHESFFCDMCKVHFFDKSDMQLHVRLTHSQKMRSCAECDEVFRSKQSLDNHLEFFHSDKPHIVCPLCQRAFIMKRKFLEHLWLHVGKRVRDKLCKNIENAASDRTCAKKVDFTPHL